MNGVSDAISVPTRLDGRNGGQGQGNGCVRLNGRSGARRKGRSMGYSLRPNQTFDEAHQVNGVYNKISRPTRMAGVNEDKNEATDALGAMVVAVTVSKGRCMGALTDPEQARIRMDRGPERTRQDH